MSSNTSTSKTPALSMATRGTKSKQSKSITLKIRPSLLSNFPHEKLTPKASTSSSSPSSSTPPTVIKEVPPSPEIKQEQKISTPSIASDAPQITADATKKRGGPLLKAGIKRSFGAISEGPPKARAKPGPKKRKLDGVLGTDEANRPWTTPAPLAGHKLGPKANQGAINAGLRALDRTGRPCRKWIKHGFHVKSFTGVIWRIPSWRAPKKELLDTNGVNGQSTTPTSTSENIANQSSSNVGSDNSRNGVAEINLAASSPGPGIATPA